MSLIEEELSETVTVYRGQMGYGVDVTSTLIQSHGEGLVFDTLLNLQDTRDLLLGIKRRGVNPTALVNTHWHIDHTAGNQLFLQTEKKIISHALCADLMRTALPEQMEGHNRALKKEDRVRPVYPNQVVVDGFALGVGDLEVEILHTPGHTPDSIIGYLKEEKVVIAGDTVMEMPLIRYGDSSTLVKSLQQVKSIPSSKIIQGHGRVCSAEKVDLDIRYIENVRRVVGEFVDSGKSADEASKIPMSDCMLRERADKIPAAYGRIHASNLAKVYAELTERAKITEGR